MRNSSSTKRNLRENEVPGRWLTVDELSERLHVAAGLVRRIWIPAGIPKYEVSRTFGRGRASYRFDFEEVRSWLARRNELDAR